MYIYIFLLGQGCSKHASKREEIKDSETQEVTSQ
jgi:hypothetical protein